HLGRGLCRARAPAAPHRRPAGRAGAADAHVLLRSQEPPGNRRRAADAAGYGEVAPAARVPAPAGSSTRSAVNPHHHLDPSTVVSYAAGALAVEMAVVAATHLETCAHCRARVDEA